MSTVPHISAMAAAQSVEREWQIVSTPAAFLCTSRAPFFLMLSYILYSDEIDRNLSMWLMLFSFGIILVRFTDIVYLLR